MNKKFSLLVLAAAGVILAAFFLVPKYQTVQVPVVSPTLEVSDPEGTTREQYYVTVSIDFGNEETISDKVLMRKPSTVYNALLILAETENLEVKTKQYDFGVFVESINGLESGNEKAWIYFVNGKSGTIAADKQEVIDSDIIEWKYIPPDGE